MPRIPDHVVSREVGGETVILSLESGNYFGLNAVGAAIWRGLAAGQTEEEIQAAIVAEFDVSGEVVKSDLADIIEKLLNQGLLEN